MQDTLEILDGSGHLTLTWQPENPEEVAYARAEVARLKAAGYQFFAVENEPADEVAAGRGSLIVQRIDDPTKPSADSAESAAEGQEMPPPKALRGGRRAVATRPMGGGADEGPVSAADLAASAPDPGDDFEGYLKTIVKSVATTIIRERSLPEAEGMRRFLARAGRRYIEGLDHFEAGEFWPSVLIEENRQQIDKLAREYARLLDREEDEPCPTA